MLIKPCEQCGKECKVPPTRVKHFHYCSKVCLIAARGITKQCAQCGKAFHVANGLIERKRFCSKACADTYYRRGEMQTRNCTVCGSEFITTAGKIRAHATCSEECAQKGRDIGLNKAQQIPNKRKPATKKVEVQCQVCGVSMQAFPCRVPMTKTCSPKCRRAWVGKQNAGRFTASELVACAFCGTPVRKFKSRLKDGRRAYCNEQCYFASNQSGLEDKIVAWLQEHAIPYQQQIKVGRFTVDFVVEGKIVEANGCYWHACPEHHPPKNAMQKRRIQRDAHLARYCAYHNIQLITLWEHEANNADFSALFALL